MPFSRLTLASLALNAGLIVFLLFAYGHDSSTGNSRPIPPRETHGAESGALEHAARRDRASTDDAAARDWKESLRKSGIPLHVFIAAIQADFHAKWDRRDAALQKRYTDGEVDIEELGLFNLDREIALEAAMREALGEEAFREWDRERKFFDINTRELALRGDETNELYSIRTALTDRLRALERSKLAKEIDPATYEERHELAQADYEQGLRKLVGFQRYNTARDSGIPAYLRRDLRGLGVSDAQFARIQEIEGDFGDERTDLEVAAQYGSIDSIKLDQEREALARLRDAKLRQTLGEEAYALYRKQQDSRYQTMIDFAKDWQLTDQNIENVYQVLLAHEIEARRTKLAAYAAGLPPEEARGQVAALQEQLNKSLLQTLTPEQAESLRRNGIVGP